IESDEEVEVFHAKAVHAEGSRAEDRVAAGVLLFLHEETRPHIAKHLAVLGIEVKAEDAEVIAIAGLRDEAEVGGEITADVLRGHAPIELRLVVIEAGEDGMRLQPLAVPGRREIGTI